VHTGLANDLLADHIADDWILISAGTFEDDIETVNRARTLARPPRQICAIAAGVHEFSRAVNHPDGTFGIAQWFAGTGGQARVGPDEREFLDAYEAVVDEAPDYPAIQAAATASTAARCARLTGHADREQLWRVATKLVTSTLYGPFKINQAGAQVSHQTALTSWTDSKLSRIDSAPLAQYRRAAGGCGAQPHCRRRVALTA
jgi:hypothetical protein